MPKDNDREHDIHVDVIDIKRGLDKIDDKKDELKERAKDNFLDNFNYWINAAFIILGILLFLTICLLIYSIFFANSALYVSSSRPVESIRMPNISQISTPVVNTYTSSLPLNISDNSVPLVSSTVSPVIVNDTKPNSGFFNSMFSSSKKPDSEIKTDVPPIITKPKSSSIFASFFSSSKKPQQPPSNSDITTNVDILNKNTSIEFKKPSVVSSFVSPLYNRKVELPQMKHTGGSYNKLLNRF
jgi:hypothetical protein